MPAFPVVIHVESGKEVEATFVTPVDVKAMAVFLGIDLQKETTLMWVAKLALMEPLPIDWEEYDARNCARFAIILFSTPISGSMKTAQLSNGEMSSPAPSGC